MKKITLLLFMAAILVSCNKPPGEGGNASITGYITKDFRLVVTNPNTYQYSVPASDESVYIIYGDHVSPDDKVETNYEGEFEFRNLRKGDYTIYVFSKDTTGLNEVENNKMPIIREVTIDGNKDEVDLGEMVVYDET